MFTIASMKNAEATRIRLDIGGDIYHRTDMMMSPPGEVQPTIYVVEQPPGAVLEPHFHRQNEFQVFIGGAGNIGPHTLEPVVVHYAGAYTGYGPLTAGPEGITYLTIRAAFERGYVAVRDAAAHMVRGPKQHFTSDKVGVTQGDEPDAHAIFPATGDGMSAQLVNVASGGALSHSWPQAAAGCFGIVVDGSLQCGDHALGRWDAYFASTPQELPVCTAGAEGVRLLALSIPLLVEAYRPK